MVDTRQHYTACMCPYCKSTFAVEVSLEGIEIKTFSVDVHTETNIENGK